MHFSPLEQESRCPTLKHCSIWDSWCFSRHWWHSRKGTAPWLCTTPGTLQHQSLIKEGSRTSSWDAMELQGALGNQWSKSVKSLWFLDCGDGFSSCSGISISICLSQFLQEKKKGINADEYFTMRAQEEGTAFPPPSLISLHWTSCQYPPTATRQCWSWHAS